LQRDLELKRLDKKPKIPPIKPANKSSIVSGILLCEFPQNCCKSE